MAYNYYPSYFQPAYTMPMQAPQTVQQAPAVQTTQNRNSDFVLVRSEDEARNYPVAFGNTVTFKDENMPYMYTKTMGMSQLDRPVFEKYKLVKEPAQDAPKTAAMPARDNETEKKLQSEIDAIWREIHALKERDKDEEGV